MSQNKEWPIRWYWLYVPGILLILALAVIAIWADLESSFYGFDRRGGKPIRGLSCPVLMSRNEKAVVSLKVRNTSDRTLSPSVRMDISTPILPASDLRSIDLSPGETRRLQWEINAENIDLDRFIFANVYVYAFYPIPDSDGTCGTFVVNLPIPGNVLLWLWIMLGAGGMGLGFYQLRRSTQLSEREIAVTRPASFLLLASALLLFVSLMGWWVQAVLLLVITLLTVVIVTANILIR